MKVNVLQWCVEVDAFTHIRDAPLDHQLNGNLENNAEIEAALPGRLNLYVEALLPFHSIHVLQKQTKPVIQRKEKPWVKIHL